MKIETAAYFFPHWHPTPRNDWVHGQGWTEWELVKAATPRFAGHDQPKVPLWGYEDESDPDVMAKKIDAAANYHLDTFIFDWMYYPQEKTPCFLNEALENGFFKASNNHRMKFALLWVYHPRVNMHPALKRGKPPVLFSVKTTPQDFERMADYIIETYFCKDSYWRIQGKPYFSIYGVGNLLEYLGVDCAARMIDCLREKTARNGIGEIHFNVTINLCAILPDEKSGYHEKKVFDFIKLTSPESLTVYNWCHLGFPDGFPTIPYSQWREKSVSMWEMIANHTAIPFMPNVTLGWDVSPRTIQTDVWENVGYPFTGIINHNTPIEIGKSLQSAKDFLNKRNYPFQYVTINAWNEWTEGCYLEPDVVNRFGYLEEIKRVFGDTCSRT